MTPLQLANPAHPHARTAADDQAARLRALVEASRAPQAPPLPVEHPRARALTIAIASGKGGVGKTTIAVNLAIALAHEGRRVALLDGDLGLANADLLCGLPMGRHLGHLLDDECSLDELARTVIPNFTLIPGASGVPHLTELDPARRRRLADALAEIEQTHDIVLVDCGAGIGPSVIWLTRGADHALIVTTPEPTAVADAYALIKCRVREPGAAPAPCELIINLADTPAQARAVHARIAAVCERFLDLPAPLAGSIPRDPAVPRAVCARSPLMLSDRASPAARALTEIARTLRTRLPPDEQTTNSARPRGLQGLARLLGLAPRR